MAPEAPDDPLKDDFRKFLYVVWKHLLLPDPTPVQYDAAHWLQHGPRRMVVQAYRGMGKSWVTSAFVLWLLYCDPQKNILVISATKQRADDFSTFTKRLIHEMPLLAFLQPGRDQRSSNVAFDVGPARAAHAPSVKSLGIGSQIAGSRADVIIVDDVEVPNNTLTQQRREKLSEQVKEFDAVLKPGGRVIYLGTPQTEETVYKALETRGYEIRIWPAEYPKPEEVEARWGDRLAPKLLREVKADRTLVGKSVDPKRFSDEDLAERKASYGRSGYALQFMLDTTLSDALKYPLKCADFVVMDVDPEMAPEKVTWASGPAQVVEEVPLVGLTGDRFYRPMYVSPKFENYQGAIMAVDPAGRGNDRTGVAIIKFLHGILWVRFAGSIAGGYDDPQLEELVRMARSEKVNLIIIEKNFGDGMFQRLLEQKMRDVYPCAFEEVSQSVQKELRIIRDVEPALNQHRIVLDKSIILRDEELPQSHQFLYQLTRLTKDRGSLLHDDALDAFAIGVKYWTDQMAVSVESQIKQKQQERRNAELERFVQSATGRRGKSGSWHRRMLRR